MTEETTGRIYLIRSDLHPELLPYYGSTIQTLKQRWGRHKSKSNNTASKELMGYSDVRIELVEELVCESIAILRKKEQWYIENNKCCNKIKVAYMNYINVYYTIFKTCLNILLVPKSEKEDSL